MKLCIKNLSFERNQQLLLDRIDYDLQFGDCLQIRGANGSGKSTLLRILAAFIHPTQGDIEWHGISVFAERDLYQQEVHYIGHQNGIKPYLTVFENLELISALSGTKRTPKDIQHVLTKMDLHDFMHNQANYLSAGQLRRLCLAKLLLQPKQVWILDEPVTSLDKEGQQLLDAMLTEHQAQNGITIIATHQPIASNISWKTLELGKHYD